MRQCKYAYYVSRDGRLEVYESYERLSAGDKVTIDNEEWTIEEVLP